MRNKSANIRKFGSGAAKQACVAAALGAVLLLATQREAAATTQSLAVDIAGRPIDAKGEYAVKRNGVVSVDLVDFTRALGGVIIYRTASGAEVALNNKHLMFRTGYKTALLDAIPFVLPAPAFSVGSRYYVPLRTLAQTAGFRVAIDRTTQQISLSLPPVPVSPTPLASQVVLAAAASQAPDGLHLTATAANLTGAPLTVAFPTSARVAFVASRDGKVLWSSLGSTRALQTKTSLIFSGNEAKSFPGFWSGFLYAGVGPISIRAELLSTPPVFSSMITVMGVATPVPTPLPSGAPQTPAPAASPTAVPTAVPTPTPLPATPGPTATVTAAPTR